MAQSNATAKLLWELAFQKLEPRETEILNEQAGKLADLNKILIDKGRFEEESKQWCLKLAGKSLKTRKLGQKVVAFIDYSRDFLQEVTANEPHAALAWTCVSLLLPVKTKLLQLITNQSSQEEAMLTGLDEVSYLIGFYATWEELYVVEGTEALRETVVKLYTAILIYQARLFHYLSRSSLNKVARDAFKKDGWQNWLEEVRLLHRRCVEQGKLMDIFQERKDRNYQNSLIKAQSETTEHMLQALKDIQRHRLQQNIDLERSVHIHYLSSDYKRQKNTYPEAVKGTCRWFIEDERFTKWRDSRESCLLHVFAGPGCGKSVLARYLVDSGSVRSSDTAVVLYFFFKTAQEGQDKCENAMAAMLHQLYTQEQGKGMISHALPKFTAHESRISTMFDELWELLQKAIEDPAAVEIICVLDALDECIEEDREKLLEEITSYFTNNASEHKAGGRLKMLITSRPYGDINLEYAGLERNTSVVQLDGSDKSDLIARETNLVINFTVPQVLPKVSKSVQHAVIEQLRQMNNRTYLWLHLVLDHIKKNVAGRGTPRKIKKLIARLPPTVNAAYESMLRKCTDYSQAKVLLQLVIAAKRPLTVSELKIAKALAEGTYSSYRDLSEDTESSEMFTDSLQNICGLLLVVYDSRVFLIHQTARDYLCKEGFRFGTGEESWNGPLESRKAELLILRSCVSLLTLREFSGPHLWKNSPSSWRAIVGHVNGWVQDYDFLEYASVYWASHGSETNEVSDDSDMASQEILCTPTLSYFWIWYPIYCRNNGEITHGNHDSLMCAFIIGNWRLAERLLEKGANVNAEPGLHRNPLYAASFRGHDHVVQTLLDHGADVNHQAGDLGNALQAAACGGHETTVKLLLDRGADINAQGGGLDNALSAACFWGHERTAQTLLDRGANVGAQGKNHGTALRCITERLHGRGGGMTVHEGLKETLSAALLKGNEKTAQTFLDRDANAGTQGRNHGTALRYATVRHDDNTERALLAYVRRLEAER